MWTQLIVLWILATAAGATAEEGDVCANNTTLQCNNTWNCINSTVDRWVEDIMNCTNGTTDGCMASSNNKMLSLCKGGVTKSTKDCYDCTHFNFTIIENDNLHNCTDPAKTSANIDLEVCFRTPDCHESTTKTSTQHSEIATTAATDSNTAAGVNPATTASSIGEALAEDTEILSATMTNTKDENRILIVQAFKTPSIGSEKEPLYKNNKSRVEVTNIVVKGNTAPLRAIILHKTNQGGNEETDAALGPPKVARGNDSGPGTVFQGSIGPAVLHITIANDRNERVEADSVAFKLDCSRTDGIDAFFQKARGNRVGTKFVKYAKLGVGFINDESPVLSDEGCGCRKLDLEPVLDCNCNHTTVFAVLLSAEIVEVPHSVKIISYITEVTSVVFLMMTGMLLAKVRKHVRGDRVKVQICVTFSILILHVLNIFHDAAAQNDTSCEIFAVLTHYFLLSSAMWMLMEGVTLVSKTMDMAMQYSSGRNARKFAIFRYVVSWVTPFIIVLISASVGFSRGNYVPKNPLLSSTGVEAASIQKYYHCWVSPEDGLLIGAVIVPIAIILFLCLVIMIRMCYVVFKMSSESENFKPTSQRRQSNAIGDVMELEHIKAALKATLVLLPVLGLPWFLGFFTALENGTASLVFMYLNAIINGLQGVFLFFVYCVIGKEVRAAIMKSYTRKKYAIASFDSSNSKHTRPSTSDTTHLAQTECTSVVEEDKSKANGGGPTVTSGV